MADNKRDLSEELFVAIETIANKSLEGLKYDRTILCTITDASNADTGEYTVSDGSVEFIAYSNDKYGENANVYVTIPQGDYNQKKYIIGKYQKENDKPYNYVSPTANYVEIINLNNEMNQVNPVTNKIQNAGSLLANKENRKVIKIFEKTNITNLNGYDMLGIKADFRTVLSDFNTISGNYGLILELVCKENYDTDYIRQLEGDLSGPNAGEDPKPLSSRLDDNASIEPLQTIEKDSVLNTYLLYFDSNEMFGNPYNFVANMSQEKAFNISDYKGIESLTLYLYQQNNFKDINNKNIPYQFESIAGSEDLPDNIFVDNIEISFGYNLSNFEDKDNILLLYSLDKKSYSQVLNGKKTIQLKWVRKIDDTIKVAVNINNVRNVFNLSSDKCKIVWYRWNLSPDVVDPLAGAFWEKCADAENKFSYQFTPNLNSQYERFKVGVIIYGDKIDQEENNEELANENSIIEEYFESEIVEFYNEQEVPNSTTLDLIYGLTLTTSDTLGGVYIIYLPNGTLMNESQKNTQRYITASYSSLFTGVTGLDGTETVTWKVPAHNTMIKIDTGTNDLIGGKRWKEKDGYWVIENAAISTEEEVEVAIGETHERKSILPFKIAETYSSQLTNNTVECIIHKNGLNYKASLPMSFGISGTNGTDYTLVFEISDPDAKALFTYASGESDRPYWLKNGKYVEASDNEVETTEDKSLFCYYRHTLQVRAQLRDYNGQVLKPDGGMTFGWYFKGSVPDTDPTPRAAIGYGYSNSQFNSEDNFYYQQVVGKIVYNENYSCGSGKFTEKNKPNPNEYVPIGLYPRIIIAKVTARYNGQNLEAYLPIPIVRLKSQCKYIFEGPTKIYYDGNGQNPTYARIPYKLWDGNNQILTDNQKLLSWKLGIYNKNNCRDYITTNGSKQARDKDNKGDGYPYLDNDNNSLVCPQIYFNNLYTDKMPCMCVYGNYKDSGGERLLWIQPILVLLNRFGSSMLNKWDGSLTIDEENNQILTSVIAAGKKEEDNSYSGIVLGEIAKASNVKDKTGLLGYNQGKQTFLLSADDGHLELGESGAGQIIMQGKSGIIKSGNYSSTDGMKINLQNGQIDAYNFKLTSNNVTIDSSTSSNAYFVIKTNDENPKDLIKMSNTAYFLQSANYDENTDGMKINLKDGKIDAYNFKLTSKHIKIDSTKDGTTRLAIYGADSLDKNTSTPILQSNNTSLLIQSNDRASISLKNINGTETQPNPSFKLYASDYNDSSATGIIMQGYNWYSDSNTDVSAYKLKLKEDWTVKMLNKDPIFSIRAPYFENTTAMRAVKNLDGSFQRIKKEDGTTTYVYKYFPTTFSMKTLLHIGTTQQYLQSSNYEKNKNGMKINLKDGQIDAYNFKLTSKNVVIDSTENATNYFTVKGYKDIVEVDTNWEPKLDEDGNENIERKNETATLMNVSRDSIDIQAADQESFKLHLTSKRRKKTYSNGSYSIKYDASYLSGKVPIYLYDKDKGTGSTKYYETIKIQNTDDPYLQINGISASTEKINNISYYTSVSSIPLLTVGKNEYKLQSANYAKATSTSPGDGMKINLKDGQIDAYNFKLTSKNVIIDSSGGNSYFKINGTNNTRISLINVQEHETMIQSSNEKFQIKITDDNDKGGFLLGHGYRWKKTSANAKPEQQWFEAIKLSSTSPFLKIQGLYHANNATVISHTYIDKNGNTATTSYWSDFVPKTLMEVGSTAWYLQSGNYVKATLTAPGDGMKINLNDGSFDAYNFKLTSKNVVIDSSGGNSYFKILGASSTTALVDVQEDYTLLQSSDKLFQLCLRSNDTASYLAGRRNLTYWSTTANNNKGALLSNTFQAIYLSNSAPYLRVSGLKYSGTTVVNNKTYVVNPSTTYILFFGNQTQYIQSANYNGSDTGMKIDFSSGRITGYNAGLNFYKQQYVLAKTTGEVYKDSEGNTIRCYPEKKKMKCKEIVDGTPRGGEKEVYVKISDSIKTTGENAYQLIKDDEGKYWSYGVAKGDKWKAIIDSSYTSYPINVNDKFKVHWNGKMESIAGTIGGWSIYKQFLSSNAGMVGMAKYKTTDSPIFWSGYKSWFIDDNGEAQWDKNWKNKVGFGVAGDGTLYANRGHIGVWTIDEDQGHKGELKGINAGKSIVLSPEGIKFGTYKKIKDDGGTEGDNITAILKPDGTIHGQYFSGMAQNAWRLQGYSAENFSLVGHTHEFSVPNHKHNVTIKYTTDTVNVMTSRTQSMELTYVTSINTQGGNEVTYTTTDPNDGSSGGSTGGGGGGGCFAKGSLILLNDFSTAPIENIKVNDIVIAYDEQSNIFVPKKVIKSYVHHNTPSMVKIYLSTGDILYMTPGHPVYTTDGWKSLDIQNSLYEHNTQVTLLQIGDKILGFNKISTIEKIEFIKIGNNYDSYNIEVEDCHTFLVNNLIVHNGKRQPEPF